MPISPFASSQDWPRKRDPFVMATILIVGNEPILLETRAKLLGDWRASTTAPKDAVAAIRSTAHDLIIFCQTISDTTAQTLINSARELNPDVLVLAIRHPDQERNLDAELYEVEITKPGRLLSVVAHLLSGSPPVNAENPPLGQQETYVV
jgi:CheY-like chemotaxis protein